MPMPTATGLVRLVRSPAAGAVFAQVWQATGSFAIQILAAHLLGATGLGTISLCLGVIVLTAAVASGLVGDGLTVLDRSADPVRAGLQVWALVLALVGPGVTAFILYRTGLVDPAAALAFALASCFFLLEELLRRVLTATMCFWRLVAVDSAALAVTLIALMVIGRGQMSPMTFLAAVAVGQAAGCLMAVLMLPRTERWVAPWRGAALRQVWGFGVWRGLQVAVNPSALTGLRVLVVAAAGLAVLGPLEAARIFVAPATLVVQGLGSYLLASYARDRRLPMAVLLRRATRAAAAMAGGALLLGGLAAALVPVAGRLVSGPEFAIAPTAVLAWSGYAAAAALMQPFASLAAARGGQRAVFAVRVGDSSLGLALLLLAVQVLHWSADVAPLALALGLVAGGIVIRKVVLPRVQRDGISTRPTGSSLLSVTDHNAARTRVRDNAIAGA
jgi:hypothetical protein